MKEVKLIKEMVDFVGVFVLIKRNDFKKNNLVIIIL